MGGLAMQPEVQKFVLHRLASQRAPITHRGCTRHGPWGACRCSERQAGGSGAYHRQGLRCHCYSWLHSL